MPRLGRSPRVGNGNPLQYSCLKNSMDREAWQATPWGCRGSDTTDHIRLIDEETMETPTDFICLFNFFSSKITADGDCSCEIKTLAPWKKSYDQPIQHIKKQRHYFANKGPSNQSYGFSSSCVWMQELDHKES